MKYDFDKIIDRTGTHTLKLDAMPKGCPEDALSAWVADMDLPCAQPILDALHERVDRQIFGYTLYHNEDCESAVREWYRRRFGWEIRERELYFSPGVVPALAMLINALTEEGDGIVIQKPVYYPFSEKIHANGRKVVNSPLKRRDLPAVAAAGETHRDAAMGDFDYVMDYGDLEEKLADPANKGMILCNPHNPVGRVWTEDELRKVLEIGRRHDKWIIADEIHGDLTRTGITYTPLLKLVDQMIAEEGGGREEEAEAETEAGAAVMPYSVYRNRIIICTAPSKTFNLAGLSMSNLMIPGREFQRKWRDMIGSRLSLTLCNPLSMTAMIAAYREGEDWLEQLRSYLDGNIAFVNEFVRTRLPKARVSACQGTYLMWLDFRGYIGEADDMNSLDAGVKKLEEAMQQHGRVALDEGYIFGEEGKGYERLNIAMPRPMVEELMERIAAAADWLER